MVPPGCRRPSLGGVDHRQADAVLDRAAGVLRFKLEEQVHGPVSKRLTRTSGVLPISSSTAGSRLACRHLLWKFALERQKPAARHRAICGKSSFGP
jgi:hypothetical protein